MQIGGLFAHVTLFWGKDVISAFKLANAKKQPDRHWIAMQKYKEAPMYWYAILLVLAFIAGETYLATSLRCHGSSYVADSKVWSSSSRETPRSRGGDTSSPSPAGRSSR